MTYQIQVLLSLDSPKYVGDAYQVQIGGLLHYL